MYISSHDKGYRGFNSLMSHWQPLSATRDSQFGLQFCSWSSGGRQHATSRTRQAFPINGVSSLGGSELHIIHCLSFSLTNPLVLAMTLIDIILTLLCRHSLEAISQTVTLLWGTLSSLLKPTSVISVNIWLYL